MLLYSHNAKFEHSVWQQGASLPILMYQAVTFLLSTEMSEIQVYNFQLFHRNLEINILRYKLSTVAMGGFIYVYLLPFNFPFIYIRKYNDNIHSFQLPF